MWPRDEPIAESGLQSLCHREQNQADLPEPRQRRHGTLLTEEGALELGSQEAAQTLPTLTEPHVAAGPGKHSTFYPYLTKKPNIHLKKKKKSFNKRKTKSKGKDYSANKNTHKKTQP